MFFCNCSWTQMYHSVWRWMQHCWWWRVYDCQRWDLRGEQQREVRDRAGQEVQCDIQQAVQPQQGEEVWQCHRYNQWTILHQFFGEKMFNHQTSRVSCHEGTERMHLCTSCFHNSNISWYIHPICRTWQNSLYILLGSSLEISCFFSFQFVVVQNIYLFSVFPLIIFVSIGRIV